MKNLFFAFCIYTLFAPKVFAHDVYQEINPGYFYNTFIYGIEHILLGYDHLLFILSTILLVRNTKKIIKLISAFTVAHSITLILSGLGLFTLSPRIVEPMIALSIIFVALDNIRTLKSEKQDKKLKFEMWWVIFILGLVHGLGFAGALEEQHLSTQYFFITILIFNIGIEVGQIVFIYLMLPILKRIDKHKSRNNLLLGISSLIALVSTYWAITQIFF